ncbi:antitoxin [Nonomuraea sp. NPDC050404]|uniref:antitoxin n=1 Tax=Nonomuraea sp. NPDC050404 TaxID=3155783 RepID=UPI00340792C3
MSRIGDWLKKAEDLARGHSKQADQVIDRAEQFVKERTGHKYDDQIGKGADAVQRRYGSGGGEQRPGEPRPGEQPPTQPQEPHSTRQQPPLTPEEERERRTPPPA